MYIYLFVFFVFLYVISGENGKSLGMCMEVYIGFFICFNFANINGVFFIFISRVKNNENLICRFFYNMICYFYS